MTTPDHHLADELNATTRTTLHELVKLRLELEALIALIETVRVELRHRTTDA